MVDLRDINLDLFDSILVMDKDSVNEGLIDDLIGGGPGDKRATSAAVGPTWDKGAYSSYLDDYINQKIVDNGIPEENMEEKNIFFRNNLLSEIVSLDDIDENYVIKPDDHFEYSTVC